MTLVSNDVISVANVPVKLVATPNGLVYTPTITIVNNGSADRWFRIAVVPKGQTLEEKHYKCPAKTAPAKTNGVFQIQQVVGNRAEIWALSDGELTFSISQPTR